MSIATSLFPAIFMTVLAIVFGVLVIVRGVSSDAVSAFIGVLVGSAITGIFQYWTSEADRRHQLRIAALEKRLETHQHAYTLWRKLLFADKHSKEIYDVVMECQDWWERNCLYLSAPAREAFLKAYQSASDHADLLASNAEAELVKSAYQDVERAGKLIVEGVNLPPISELETKLVQKSKK
jgi:hypothetical protein